jgi:hypothetical protein
VVQLITEAIGMNNDTIRKLQLMRLPAFIKSYQEQASSPELFCSMSFEERLAIMVDAEFDARENNKIKRLLHQSGIPDSSAHMGGIEFLPDRHLDKELLGFYVQMNTSKKD